MGARLVLPHSRRIKTTNDYVAFSTGVHMCTFVYWVIILECIFVTSCVLFCYVCTAVLHISVDRLQARSQYPEGPATGHRGTGFSWFHCV